jgi:asparagine synthase (glutamine-hydrolysing)
MQLRDFETYLPEGILTKTDRTGMAVGLEVRVPLLDKRVLEYAWSLPLAMKVRDEQAKWLPRQVLYRYVPPALVDRPKMGFTVPMGSWLRRELRDWADDLLSERALAESGLLQVPPIRRRWREHLSGARQGDHALWPILMFQAWHRHVKSAPVQAEAAPEQPVPETVGVVR